MVRVLCTGLLACAVGTASGFNPFEGLPGFPRAGSASPSHYGSAVAVPRAVRTSPMPADDIGLASTVSTYLYGSNYTGAFKDGFKHGHGVKRWDDGRVYDGEWRQGLRDGSGRQGFADGRTYDGDWRGGRQHGNGRMLLPDGKGHDGAWRDGRKHGYGYSTFEVGASYRGLFVNGLKQGLGTYVWGQGQGQGQGTTTTTQTPVPSPPSPEEDASRAKSGDVSLPAASCWYSGLWDNDVMAGAGTRYYPDGSVYHGGWSEGQRAGYGSFTHSPTASTYFGGWRRDAKHGRGVYRDGVGTQYCGAWSEGKQEGEGVMVRSSGTKGGDASVYVGEWAGGVPHGVGTMFDQAPTSDVSEEAEEETRQQGGGGEGGGSSSSSSAGDGIAWEREQWVKGQPVSVVDTITQESLDALIARIRSDVASSVDRDRSSLPDNVDPELKFTPDFGPLAEEEGGDVEGATGSGVDSAVLMAALQDAMLTSESSSSGQDRDRGTADGDGLTPPPSTAASTSEGLVSWSTHDVVQWIKNDLGLPQHAGSFEDAAVDGAVLATLSDDDLESLLGVEHPLHRRKILINAKGKM